MKRPVLTVGCTPMGDPTTGVWCDTCALPSAMTLPVGLSMDGAPFSLVTFGWCSECHRTWRP